ncbi:unnamed protein product [Blepharisma stoltei]|uniref:hydroxymethylglutaryl-CoA lyase n=1 Tax=Blepharisma stoltei TaxID=1481888 RepID=A0AAU9JTR8_9CILI|nr:unnamed protein product [Blepharisma stoltei]
MRALREITTHFKGKNFPKFVTIKEVGPSDGLINEKKAVSLEKRVEFVNRLSECGYKYIEATRFVNSKGFPQMADNTKLFQQIHKAEGICYYVFIPNLNGLESALQASIKEISIFASASESYSERFLNTSIAKSFIRYEPLMEWAYDNNLKIRGTVACSVGCPFEGNIDPMAVRDVAKRMQEMGCYEICLEDSNGVGTPTRIQMMLQAVLKDIPPQQLALHCHNTRGRAIQNILTGLEMGVTIVDSSIAALGGCQFESGKVGNVSTEDVVHVLSQLGVETGLNLSKLEETANWISSELGRENRSLYRSIS